MSTNTNKAWYLVQCKSRQYERKEKHLQRQGYSSSRSTYKLGRLLKGYRMITLESLFPVYLFIQMSLQDSWSSLCFTRGVSRVVWFGMHPLPISDALVNELRERNHQGVVVALLKPDESLRPHKWPSAELEAVFLTMEGEERAVC
ncbi:transcription termination/antitermination NusG family protein [Pseudomonas paracarnis]|uniref:transcription termination/antitermination NusG family protein n=1 Tax=Pseudomonas paracarnis TaxID=2750625 RepID=UPI002FE1E9BE